MSELYHDPQGQFNAPGVFRCVISRIWSCSLQRFGRFLPQLVTDVIVEDARWRPADGSWSIVEVVSHLCDEEEYDFRARVRSTLESPEKPWDPIDPPGWAVERRYNERDLATEAVRSSSFAPTPSPGWGRLIVQTGREPSCIPNSARSARANYSPPGSLTISCTCARSPNASFKSYSAMPNRMALVTQAIGPPESNALHSRHPGIEIVRSGEKFLHHAGVGDSSKPLLQSIFQYEQVIVVEPQQVQDRGVPVRNGDFILHGRQAQLVGGANGDSSTNTCAGHPATERVLVVIAARFTFILVGG
ncbi:MAG: DinB family protein [Planctomycetes bacterium]|nr:DinB family protein [Planctomycetota bacterium]